MCDYIKHFLIAIVGEDSKWCQPRIIMMMEKLVKWWLGGETEVLGENLPLCRFVHHKAHMLSGREPGRLRWKASD
jgi:hypothetical protein